MRLFRSGSIKVTKVKYPKPSINGPHYIYDIYNDKRVLKKKSKPVKDIDEVKPLIDYMGGLVANRANNAIGLAAIQLGLPLQIIAVRLTEKPYYDMPIVLVNPKVIETSGPNIINQEGCLSVPGRWFEVTRPKIVTMQYIKPGVGEITYTFKNYDARVVLHEMDHIAGKTLLNTGKEVK